MTQELEIFKTNDGGAAVVMSVWNGCPVADAMKYFDSTSQAEKFVEEEKARQKKAIERFTLELTGYTTDGRKASDLSLDEFNEIYSD